MARTEEQRKQWLFERCSSKQREFVDTPIHAATGYARIYLCTNERLVRPIEDRNSICNPEIGPLTTSISYSPPV